MESNRSVQITKQRAGLAILASTVVPAMYAWAMTVVPVACVGGTAPWAARAAAMVGPLFLVAAAGAELRGRRRVSSLCFCGFTFACAVVWASGMRLTDTAPHGMHAVAGTLAWALFALSWAAPPLTRSRQPAPVVASVPRAGNVLPIRASLWLGLGASGAMGLQMMGWEGAGAERAVLARLASIAAGIALVGASVQIALAGHGRRRAK